ncbi:hypothetical protein GCM10009850_044420 [Nonomuraea monospora]|uniref:Uncharacterized protein n=1 Tax=Nonomuraea monospora TaxID=568818 RepID=A0ABN3CIQ1_9ACTN
MGHQLGADALHGGGPMMELPGTDHDPGDDFDPDEAGSAEESLEAYARLRNCGPVKSA